MYTILSKILNSYHSIRPKSIYLVSSIAEYLPTNIRSLSFLREHIPLFSVSKIYSAFTLPIFQSTLIHIPLSTGNTEISYGYLLLLLFHIICGFGWFSFLLFPFLHFVKIVVIAVYIVVVMGLLHCCR